MKQAKVIPGGEIRVLKTDDELLFAGMSSKDRITHLRALAKAKAVFAVPEAIDVAVDIMRTSESNRDRLTAIKLILDRGLGGVTEEEVQAYVPANEHMSNEDIEKYLGTGDAELGDSGGGDA